MPLQTLVFRVDKWREIGTARPILGRRADAFATGLRRIPHGTNRSVKNMLVSDTKSFAGFLIDAVAVFVFVLWLWLLITTATDLFRRKDVSDAGKFLWGILLVGLPYVGTFAYILLEGTGMAERKRVQAEEMRDALRQFVGCSPADELLKLDRLKAQNVISNEEYLMLRARLVG